MASKRRSTLTVTTAAIGLLLGAAVGACSGAPAGPAASGPGGSAPSAPGATAAVAGASGPAPASGPAATASTAPAPTVGSIKDMDVCALISTAEIEATTGYDVDEGELLDLQSETAACQWEGTDPKATQFVGIAVFEYREGAFAPPDPLDKNGEIVMGIGDEAYRKEIGLSGTAGDLVVHAGDRVINVTVYNDQRKYRELHPQQETFAKLVLSRL